MGDVTEIRYSVGTGLEVRAEGDGQPAKLEGYAAVYNRPSVAMRAAGRTFVETIKPGAFGKTLADPAAEVKADIGHNRERVFARRSKGTLTLTEDDVGLKATMLPGDDTDGRDALAKVRRGDIDQMSFEFRVRPNGEQWDRQPDGSWVRTLTDLELMRVTVTAEPAYPDTSVAVRSLEAVAEVEATEATTPAVPADYFRLKLARLK